MTTFVGKVEAAFTQAERSFRGRLLGALFVVVGLIVVIGTTGPERAWWPPLAGVAAIAAGVLIMGRVQQVSDRRWRRIEGGE